MIYDLFIFKNIVLIILEARRKIKYSHVKKILAFNLIWLHTLLIKLVNKLRFIQ